MLRHYIKLMYGKWLGLLLTIGVLNALINIGIIISEDLTHYRDIDWIFYCINEFTGSLVPILLLPFLFWFFESVPLSWRSLVLYLFVTLIFGFIYTSIMYGARVPLYQLAGITRLDEIFNQLHWRYLMEYFKQFFTFWLLYLVFWGIQQYNVNRDRVLRENELKRDLLQAQLLGLQRQLHPHFFFNTLNTISSLLYEAPEQADRLITRLSDFLRSVIGLKENVMHSIDKELTLLQEYLDVMLARYGDRLQVAIHADEQIRSSNMPVLLLQPLVENAILYSMGYSAISNVTVTIEEADNHIIIAIQDEGPGIQAGEISFGSGLRLVQEKLDKIYQGRYQMTFENQSPSGLIVTIQIPKIVPA